MTKNYIPSLGGLRALSIVFVLISHVRAKNFSFVDSPGGQIGVNIFFVISGFLITLLLLEEENAYGSISLKKFYLRRSFRIFPVYYFLLFVYFILQLLGILHLHINSWITSLTYTKYFPVENGHEWETGHFWSLSIEEHFYLLWPLIFKFLKSYRIPLALLVVIITPIFRGLYFAYNIEAIGEMTIFQRADAIMWGCLFAIYKTEILAFVHRIKIKHSLLIFFPLGGLFLALFVKRMFINKDVLLGCFIKALAGSYGVFTNIFIGFVILLSITPTNNLWYNILNAPLMNYVGKLSYSIYIWQQLFFSKSMGVFSTFPLNLLSIFIVANLSYYFIEKPFLKLKARYEIKV